MSLGDASRRFRQHRGRAAAACARRAPAGSRRSGNRSCSRPGSSRTRGHARADALPGRSRSRRRRRPRRPACPRWAGRRRRRCPVGRRRRPVRFAPQPGHIDARMRPRRPRQRLPRLGDRLVRDAARVDDGHIGAALRARCGRRRAAARESPGRPRTRPCSRENAPRTSPPSAKPTRAHARKRVGRPAVELEPAQPVASPASPATPTARSRTSPPRPRLETRQNALDDGEQDVHDRDARRRQHRRQRVRADRLERDAVARRVLARALDATGSSSSATIGSKPSFAAASATTPEPQPTSSRLPRWQVSQVLDAEAGRRVRAGAERAARLDEDGRHVRGGVSQGGPSQTPPAATGRWNRRQASSQPGSTDGRPRTRKHGRTAASRRLIDVCSELERSL